MEYRKLKGTYDILPEESDFFSHIIRIIYRNAEIFGYKEVVFPIIEYAGLFQRSVGDASDIIVKKEMYVFEDRGKRLIALRPEGTAPCVRLYLENNLFMRGHSAKLFYFGPMFRSENPQAGRFRQFYQFGFEYLGDASPYVDAELILLNYAILKELGVSKFDLHLNSIGCNMCRDNYITILREYFKDHLIEMCKDCNERYEKNILRILDCKEEKCNRYIREAPSSFDFLCEDCKTHLKVLREILDSKNIGYKMDGRLVRGLDYYNRTVFEFKSDLLGSQSTFSAGGRYDYLVRSLGGSDIPAAGFAIGMERLSTLIEIFEGKNKKDFYIPPTLYVATIGDKSISKGIEVIEYFRREGISVVTEYKFSSLKKHLSSADKIGCRFAIFVGEDEIKKDKFILRRLSDGMQWEGSLQYLLDVVKNG